MNILRKLAFILLASVSIAMTTPLSARVALVGTVTDVNVYAFGTQPQSKRTPKFMRDGVVQGELLETVTLGSMIVNFVDDTTLTLGSSARLLVDEMVFDPQNKINDSAVIKMMVGSFYYVSGHLSKNSVVILTPAATIGIRGTEFYVEVSPTGKTTVGVISGAVEVTSATDQTTMEAIAGQTLSVSRAGISVGQGVKMTKDVTINHAIKSAAKAGNKVAKEAVQAAEKVAQKAGKAVEKAAKADKRGVLSASNDSPRSKSNGGGSSGGGGGKGVGSGNGAGGGNGGAGGGGNGAGGGNGGGNGGGQGRD